MTELSSFYQHPSYLLLVSIIESIDADPNLPTSKDVQSPIMAFFTVAFERYPEKIGAINSLSDSLGNVKDLVREAIRLSGKHDAILHWKENKPVTIDMLWFGYFASGESSYLKRLISEMSLCDRTDSIDAILTGYGAKYSLAIRARQFPEVRQFLEDASGNASGKLLQNIHDILNSSPGEIYEQMLERQRQYNSDRM